MQPHEVVQIRAPKNDRRPCDLQRPAEVMRSPIVFSTHPTDRLNQREYGQPRASVGGNRLHRCGLPSHAPGTDAPIWRPSHGRRGTGGQPPLGTNLAPLARINSPRVTEVYLALRWAMKSLLLPLCFDYINSNRMPLICKQALWELHLAAGFYRERFPRAEGGNRPYYTDSGECPKH